MKRRGRPPTGRKPNSSIRVDPEALHKARVAAVTARKTLGQWLEEAIEEKIERERKSGKEWGELVSQLESTWKAAQDDYNRSQEGQDEERPIDKKSKKNRGKRGKEGKVT